LTDFSIWSLSFAFTLRPPEMCVFFNIFSVCLIFEAAIKLAQGQWPDVPLSPQCPRHLHSIWNTAAQETDVA
jgi:hypothetical protein